MLRFGLVFSVCALSACPQALPPQHVEPPGAVSTGQKPGNRGPHNRDPEVAAWVAAAQGTDNSISLSAEEKAIALQIAKLDDLRADMRSVLDALPAQKEAALDLEKRLKVLDGKLQKNFIEQVLEQAKQELQASLSAQHGSSALLVRAKAIDAALAQQTEPQPAQATDSPRVRKLRIEHAKQHQGTMSLAAATRVAFRALAVIEQMRIAIPRLEAQANTRP